MAATKTIDRLMALAQLERAKNVDQGAYVEAFIFHGKAWAEAEGIPAAAFEQMGVPQDVLQAAGIIIVGGRQRSVRTVRVKVLAAPRKPAVKAEELEAGVLAFNQPFFTVKDVSERVGGSTVTVKAAINRLEAQGKVVASGERAGQRGRAAKVWTLRSDS